MEERLIKLNSRISPAFLELNPIHDVLGYEGETRIVFDVGKEEKRYMRRELDFCNEKERISYEMGKLFVSPEVFYHGFGHWVNLHAGTYLNLGVNPYDSAGNSKRLSDTLWFYNVAKASIHRMKRFKKGDFKKRNRRSEFFAQLFERYSRIEGAWRFFCYVYNFPEAYKFFRDVETCALKRQNLEDNKVLILPNLGIFNFFREPFKK